MKNSRLSNLVVNDYFFSIIVKFTMIAVSVIHSAFLARFLGAELKGFAATITSSVSLFQVIITCGIHQAYPYFKKQGEIKDFLSVFANNIYFIYSVLIVGAISFSTVFSSILSAKSLFVIVLTPVFAYETIVSYVYLIENSKKKNLWSLISNFSETIIILIFWMCFEPDYFLMVISVSASVIIRAISATIGLGVSIDIKKISLKFIASMLKFGLMPMAALILTIMNSKIDILMMDMNSSVTSVAIGLYSVGIGISDKILAIPDAVREILLSKLVSGKNEKEVARVTRISVLLCTAMAVVFSIVGKLIIHLLYGVEYAGSYNILVISSYGTVFMVFLKMISQYNIVNKRQVANLLMLFVSVATNIIFNLLLIPNFGITGAALASFIGHFVCAICFITYFCKKTDIKFRELILPQKEDFSAVLNFRKRK